MKYFDELYQKISLPSNNEETPDVFEIRKHDSVIIFTDQVYSSLEMSEDQAIELLQEAIDWIKSNGQEKQHPAPPARQTTP